MFDIVTIEKDNPFVQEALQAILSEGKNILMGSPEGNYRLIEGNKISKFGNGGTCNKLVIIGTGGPNMLSNHLTWRKYCEQLPHEVVKEWQKKPGVETVWIVASGVSAPGNAVGHGNIANEVKSMFPDAKVWATSGTIDSHTLDVKGGVWEKL